MSRAPAWRRWALAALGRADSVLARFGDPRWVRPGGGWVDGDLLAAADAQGYRVTTLTDLAEEDG